MAVGHYQTLMSTITNGKGRNGRYDGTSVYVESLSRNY